MRDYVRKRRREFAVEPEKIDCLGQRARKFPPKSKEDLPQSDSRSDSFFERGARLDKLVARTTPANELIARDRDAAKGDLPGLSHRRREELTNLTDQFFANGGAIRTSRRGAPLTDALQRAIARLKPRQQAVYRARVLTDPPVPRDKLARQLGIRDPTQVSRILRQAERKVARMRGIFLLNENPAVD
jgi:hypothetical protein